MNLIKKNIVNVAFFLFLLISFSCIHNTVSYDYMKFKKNSYYVELNKKYINTSNKTKISNLIFYHNYDSCFSISKGDTALSIRNNLYCDTNYLYVELRGSSTRYDTTESVFIEINSNELISKFKFPSYKSLFAEFKVKKTDNHFTIKGLTKCKEFDIKIDPRYHNAHIFQQLDSNKIFCIFDDNNGYNSK